MEWNEQEQNSFINDYETIWADFNFDHPARLIIEWLAVYPDYLGQGLGSILLHHAFTTAKNLGHKEIGLTVITGNDKAKTLYDNHFSSLVTYHSAYFDDDFPGLEKMIKRF